MRILHKSLTMAVLIAMTATSSQSQSESGHGHRKRQVTSQGVVVDTQQDRQPQPTLVQVQAAAASPVAAVHAHAKFFQYAHVPKKDHYEIGHRKGNEHHFTERHEKAHPDSGEFKTKVRWGDKHGGYGEHYWDYNHAGHGGDSHDEPSDNVHEYEEYDSDRNRNKRDSKQQPESQQSSETRQHQQESQRVQKRRRSSETRAIEGRHRDRPAELYQQQQQHETPHQAQRMKKETPKTELYLDESTGRIVDKSTGQAYTLQPVA